MTHQTGDTMGELVDLAEYRARKDQEEEEQLRLDIERLKRELKALQLEAMDPVLGPILWPDDFKDRWLPQIDTMIQHLDGYTEEE